MAGIQRIADSFGVTPRRVQQLAKEGMPKGGRGDYDEVICLRWFVKYLQEKMASGATSPNGELSGRERLANTKAAREDLLLAQDLKQVLTLADYEDAVSKLITPARIELLAIEARLRPRLGEEAAARCGQEIRRALRHVSEEIAPE